MFGHNDDTTPQNTNDIPDESIHGVLQSESPAIPPQAPATPLADWQHPGAPLGGGPAPISDVTTVITPSAPLTQPSPPPSAPSLPPDSSPPPAQADSDTTTHELIDIKQQALGQLTPLLGQLDQAPEEKFRTIMMMIQASDDQSMIKTAYEAAHAIQDEKARAQALLDIVNEINYFTSQHQA